MSELQLSSKLQYQELLTDSSQALLSQTSDFSPKNWPRIVYEDRNLNPAGIKVISAEIPVVFDTLLEGSNRLKVTANVLGVDLTLPLYITPGNYNVDELISELTSQLNILSPGWVITWNDQVQKFTFSHPNPFTFDFTPIENLKTSLYKFLGFEKDGIYSSSGTLTSVNVANPSGPLYLYLNSKQLGQEINALVQDNNENSAATQICRIPINVQRGSVIFYSDPTPNNFFDFTPGFRFQSIDLYFTIESAYGYQVVDFKGSSFSVKVALLTYRGGGSNIMAKPTNSRFAGS